MKYNSATGHVVWSGLALPGTFPRHASLLQERSGKRGQVSCTCALIRRGQTEVLEVQPLSLWCSLPRVRARRTRERGVEGGWMLNQFTLSLNAVMQTQDTYESVKLKCYTV